MNDKWEFYYYCHYNIRLLEQGEVSILLHPPKVDLFFFRFVQSCGRKNHPVVVDCGVLYGTASVA